MNNDKFGKPKNYTGESLSWTDLTVGMLQGLFWTAVLLCAVVGASEIISWVF